MVPLLVMKFSARSLQTPSILTPLILFPVAKFSFLFYREKEKKEDGGAGRGWRNKLKGLAAPNVPGPELCVV